MKTPLTRLEESSTIEDVLSHPAFVGFGALLFPWDNRPLERDMALRDVATLMPYHSHVDTKSVVDGLNQMIEDAENGRTIFLDIYSEAQKRSNPSMRNAGIFFFPARPNAPFALIAPGGGFSYVGSLHEGFPFASSIRRSGYNAFVVRYRAGMGGEVATQDMAAALTVIVRHADCLGVAPTGYSLWGSSAGARMAAAIGSHGAQQFGGDALPPPSAVIMAYTGHSDYSASEPPTYVIVGERDGIAPPQAMERRISHLRQMGTRVAYQKVPGLGHGFGTGSGTAADGWIDAAITFWQNEKSPGKPRP